MSSESVQRKRSLSLYLIAAVAVLPILGAYSLYFLWRPSSFTNYGELITPVPLADVPLPQPDGSRFSAAALRGKWAYLIVDGGGCDPSCVDKLYKIRQVRLTQGEKMGRVERAWLIDDDIKPSPAIASDYPGTRFIYAKESPLVRALPASTSPRHYIYLIDPLGNVMMRYPRTADPNAMKKDLTRLLKVSRIG